MRKHLKHLKNEKGLTLVELLAVIVILGIIAAIAVPAVGNIIENSRKDAQIANAESIYNAARLALISENVVATEDNVWTFHAVQSNEDQSDKDTDRNVRQINLIDERYLDAPPQDPHGDGPYSEAYVTYDGTEYTIVLDSYFNDGDNTGRTISDIRSGDRDIVNLD